MLPYTPTPTQEAGIVIVGLGGAGAHILQRFSGSSAENVRLCIMSPDERLGQDCGNVDFLQLGASLSHGLGSGGDPEVGRQSIEESREAIAELLKDTRLLVMVTGLGGGTGSGAAPVLAQMAADAGVMLVSVAVMPYSFEGKRRRAQAEAALDDISRLSDIVFCFENDYMEDLLPDNNKAGAVFEEANTLLSQATAAIPMFVNAPGLINIGLDEMMAALRSEDSRCIYGTGKGYGPRRAEDAARAALASPLAAYHDSLGFARSVIVHVAGGSNMSLTEVRTAVETVRAALGEEVDIFFGTAVKPRLGEEMRVSLLASVDYHEFRAAVQADKEAELAAAAAAEEEAAQAALREEPVAEEEVFDEAEAEEMAADEADAEEEPAAETPEEEGEELFSASEDDRRAAERYAPEPPKAAPAPVSRYAPPAEREAAQQMELFGMGSEPQPSSPRFDRPAAPKVSHSHASEDDDFARRVQSLFPDDGTPSTYTQEQEEHRRRANANDLDTPPSLRYNDLRDMFPDD